MIRTNRLKNSLKIGGIWIFVLVVLFSGLGITTVDQYSHSTPQFCASCHNMENHVESYLSSKHLDNIHYQANVGCKDCHSNYTVSDEISSFWKYVIGDYDRVHKKHKFEDDMCLTCHISAAYRAAQTDHLRRNPHLSHWPELRCGSCHIAHGEQIDYCSRCHENGGQRMTGQPILPRTHNPWAETSVSNE